MHVCKEYEQQFADVQRVMDGPCVGGEGGRADSFAKSRTCERLHFVITMQEAR